jgi:hypothetical protein
MTLQLMRLDYEQLAEMELSRAALCDNDQTRSRHRNRATAYTRRSEEAPAGRSQAREVLTLIGDLSVSLDEADCLGFAASALHIDAAIMELGGIGVPPPNERVQD